MHVVSHNHVIFKGGCVPVDSDCGLTFRRFLSREDWGGQPVHQWGQGGHQFVVRSFYVLGCIFLSLRQASEDYRAPPVR